MLGISNENEIKRYLDFHELTVFDNALRVPLSGTVPLDLTRVESLFDALERAETVEDALLTLQHSKATVSDLFDKSKTERVSGAQELERIGSVIYNAAIDRCADFLTHDVGQPDFNDELKLKVVTFFLSTLSAFGSRTE